MNQIDFSSIQSPVNQLAIKAAILIITIIVTFGIAYNLLIKFHSPKPLASLIALACTFAAIYKTLLFLFI